MSCCEVMPGVHVCRTDGETKAVAGKRRKQFWCFKCRKRLFHTLMGFYPTPPSYYGPHWWWQCQKCGEDNTQFPGW